MFYALQLLKLSSILSVLPIWSRIENGFYELNRQLFRTRAVATGGLLKHVLRLDEETDQDLIKGDDDQDDLEEPIEAPLLAFNWRKIERRYWRFHEKRPFVGKN